MHDTASAKNSAEKNSNTENSKEKFKIYLIGRKKNPPHMVELK